LSEISKGTIYFPHHLKQNGGVLVIYLSATSFCHENLKTRKGMEEER
jgi:hypothetical protein